MPPSSDILWRPSASRIEAAALTSFTRFASARAGRPLADYDALHRWSIEDTSAFWQAVADFCGLIWQQPASRAYTPPPAGGMLGARWFEGATLSFAENLLTPVTRTPDAEVVVSHAEGRGRVALRGRELLSAVARCAAALEAHGVGPGDRVVGILANVPEALVAMLATAARGAVWSSCSPDFGAAAVCDRFGQVAPKVVFFTTAYLYGGKRFSTKAAVEEALARLPARLAVAVDHLEDAPATPLAGAVETIAWGRFLGTGSPRLEFVPRRFDDPQYILFSSGTTGVPKCITHGVGGTLLQHAKELVLHCDLKAGDRLLYYTTCGWMMWNWMASALACGATLALYEGSPASPDTGALWRVAADEGVTHLGVSPKYLAACAAEGLSPRELLAGARLRTLLSTGAPLLPEQFAWVYREVAADLHLASISGGTDIVSCFMLGVPTLPVRAGEIQRAGLGMAIEAWDETGHPVRGRKGELVCVQPFPSMPVSFWNDPDGVKYRNAYFAHYEREVWRHGDFVEITAEGGVVVYGRSDATLNPGGVRIGTAELYRQVETLPEVADSLAIGREADGDTEIWLFVKLRDARPLDAALETRIKATIREALTPRHVPRRIIAVQDIPYTRSGKKVELAVTEAVHGRPVTNLAALANPEAMGEYVAMGRR